MKGYRTLAFGVATILLGLIGVHVAPDTLTSYMDLIFGGLGVGVIVLRLVTDGPVFNKVAADAGLSADDIAKIRTEVQVAVPDVGILGSALGDLAGKIDALAGRNVIDPDLVAKITALVTAKADPAPVPAAADPAVPAPVAQPQPAGAA